MTRISKRLDRNDAPGVTLNSSPVDQLNWRQIIETTCESLVLHSKSRGWIPSLRWTLRSTNMEGGDPQEVTYVMDHDSADAFAEELTEVARRARLDLNAARKSGQLLDGGDGAGTGKTVPT